MLTKKWKFLVGISLLCLSLSNAMAEESPGDTALLLIDIQNFYFPEGRMELVEPEKASLNAQKLLVHFRNMKLPVIHIRHNFEPGGEIHIERPFPLLCPGSRYKNLS